MEKLKNIDLILTEYEISSILTCAVAYKINSNNPYLKPYCEKEDQTLILLTGHQDGSVYLWENFGSNSEREEVVKYSNGITCISNYKFGLAIATEACIIYLRNFNLKQDLKQIDITSFPFKIFNY